jgi:leucine dehydrogenase
VRSDAASARRERQHDLAGAGFEWDDAGAMSALDLVQELGHEEILVLHDRAAGLQAVIAIHDTTLGPAVGGTRMQPYASLDAALTDALRLARAMTYKAALAGVDRGGGKAVIIGDPGRDKTRSLLQAYAKVLERLGDRFHSAPDMGIDGRDVAVLSRMTSHISRGPRDSELDAADLTALGVLESIRAAARLLDLDLEGLHVAVQGLGQVGHRLVKRLAAEGARLTVADRDPGRVERSVEQLGLAAVEPDAIYDVAADVFSPNAGGGILNQETVPRLRVRAVVGAANGQLAEGAVGLALLERGILYAPDYVANAGGLLSLLLEAGEADERQVTERVRGIGTRLSELWERSEHEGTPPQLLAEQLAEERLAKVRDLACLR